MAISTSIQWHFQDLHLSTFLVSTRGAESAAKMKNFPKRQDFLEKLPRLQK
jgi:hypothetical protein